MIIGDRLSVQLICKNARMWAKLVNVAVNPDRTAVGWYIVISEREQAGMHCALWLLTYVMCCLC